MGDYMKRINIFVANLFTLTNYLEHEYALVVKIKDTNKKPHWKENQSKEDKDMKLALAQKKRDRKSKIKKEKR